MICQAIGFVITGSLVCNLRVGLTPFLVLEVMLHAIMASQGIPLGLIDPKDSDGLRCFQKGFTKITNFMDRTRQPKSFSQVSLSHPCWGPSACWPGATSMPRFQKNASKVGVRKRLKDRGTGMLQVEVLQVEGLRNLRDYGDLPSWFLFDGNASYPCTNIS